jgi:hypothetical protein
MTAHDFADLFNVRRAAAGNDVGDVETDREGPELDRLGRGVGHE